MSDTGPPNIADEFAAAAQREAAAQPAAATHYDVAIVGAGVAGLAAAVALAADGKSVVLLERRPFVGGRAYSYPHPALNEVIDSQHVVLGCCTNFIDLITQSGAAHTIRWYDTLTFLEPGSHPTEKYCHPEPAKRAEGPASSSSPDAPSCPPTASTLKPSSLLPAPLHQSLSFLRAPMLSLRDKLGIAYGLAHFLRGYPATDEESFAAWLQRTHQTDRAIRHFWEPVIVAALNDTFANCSTRYAGKVFHESFLRSPAAGRLGIPTAPLSDFFAPVAAHATALGVDLRLNTPADHIIPLPNHRYRIATGTTHIEANALILATDLRQAHRLQAELSGGSSGLQPAVEPTSQEGALAPEITASRYPEASSLPAFASRYPEASDLPPFASRHPEASALPPFASRHPEASALPAFASRYPEASASGLSPTQKEKGALAPGVCLLDPTQFTLAPITTIHLWYDREITPLDHAVLLDTRIQWLFHKSRIRNWPASHGTYLELVISASHAELKLSREQILADALQELALFFPQIREAKLLKSAVLKEARATFSVTPNLDSHRPPQTTEHPNLYLAGDYTATDWPSTMESAVRSGRLAAALAANHPRTHFLSPELPPAGLMRLLSRKK
ncbi:MAG TPA: FAD-dependent oxidoreductase [Acidobacteriaceae bacterium]|nr:FAD-dependent oxidoreductase [Acidobacteriaceae bacterium]